MSGGLVVQVVVSGLAAGAAYGLVGIGFALVHRLTGVVQLAHGDLTGGAVFVALLLASGTGPVTLTDVSEPRLIVAAVNAVLITAAVSALFYAVVLRPVLRRGEPGAWVGAVVAGALAVEGALSAAFPRESYVFPDLFRVSATRPLALGGGAVLQWGTLIALAIGAAVAVVIERWLARSETGVALAAIASDPVAASLVGLPVERLVTAAFAIAGGLAAVAGVVTFAGAPVSPQTGLVLGLKGMAAALAAGLGSPRRVFVAALILGVGEAAVASLHVPGLPSLGLGPAWRDVVPLLVVVAGVALVRWPAAREPVE